MPFPLTQSESSSPQACPDLISLVILDPVNLRVVPTHHTWYIGGVCGSSVFDLFYLLPLLLYWFISPVTIDKDYPPQPAHQLLLVFWFLVIAILRHGAVSLDVVWVCVSLIASWGKCSSSWNRCLRVLSLKLCLIHWPMCCSLACLFFQWLAFKLFT